MKPPTLWSYILLYFSKEVQMFRPLFLLLSIVNICSAPHVYTYTLGAEVRQAWCQNGEKCKC